MGSQDTILIVDDDPSVREAIEAALASRYTVHAVADASAALDAICAQPYDLILLDHRLPDLPGTDVLKLVKRFFPSTVVILITGFGSEDVAIEALRGGARDYIRKPVDCMELQSRVAALLDLRRAATERRQNPYVQQQAPQYPLAISDPQLQPADLGRAILKAIRYIDEHLDAVLNLAAVARAAGMSKYHFCRRFRTVTGLYFREYLARRRIARAKELLRDQGRTITDVLHDVGFKDMTHFARVFRKLEGQLPSQFRRRLGSITRGRRTTPGESSTSEG